MKKIFALITLFSAFATANQLELSCNFKFINSDLQIQTTKIDIYNNGNGKYSAVTPQGQLNVEKQTQNKKENLQLVNEILDFIKNEPTEPAAQTLNKEFGSDFNKFAQETTHGDGYAIGECADGCGGILYTHMDAAGKVIGTSGVIGWGSVGVCQ